jgi:hypothetical protein
MDFGLILTSRNNSQNYNAVDSRSQGCGRCSIVKRATNISVYWRFRITVKSAKQFLDVRPSVCTYQHGYHRKNLLEYWNRRFSWKSVHTLHICTFYSIRSKMSGTLREDTCVSLLLVTQIRHKSTFVQRSTFLYCWQWHVTQEYTKKVFLPFHCNNG